MNVTRRATLVCLLARVFVVGLVLVGCRHDPVEQLYGTWDLATLDAGSPVLVRVFSPDGTYSATSTEPTPARTATHETWTLEDGKVLHCYADTVPMSVSLIELSPDTLKFKTGPGKPDQIYKKRK